MTLYLAQNDAPCPACGYNLRDLTTDHCPECNQRLRLALRLDESCTGQLIGAICGLVACSGAGGLLLLFVSWMTFTHPGSRLEGEERITLLVLPLVAIAGFGTPAWLLGRRPGRAWFVRRSSQARWFIVVACWVVPASFFVYYIHRFG